MNTNWADLHRDGRRLEAIIKSMNTKYHTTTKESLKLAYVDRIIKATNTKFEIIKTVLGVREVLKKAKETQDKVNEGWNS